LLDCAAGAAVLLRESARTIHVFTETPSRLAATSSAPLSASGSRRVMRAVNASSAPAAGA